jgi:hypothetical protein
MEPNDKMIEEWLKRNRTQVEDRPQLQIEDDFDGFPVQVPEAPKEERGVCVITF